MRIGVASSFACGVGVWRRLMDEGADVLVWRGGEKDGTPHILTSHRLVGKGIVPLVDSWHALLDWCKEGMRSGEPTMLLFDSSGLGPMADEARKAGVHVVGGGGFCDRLEKDRAFGRDIALSVGIESPGVVEFPSLDACMSFAKSGKLHKAVYFKSNAYVTGDATHKCEDAQELIEWLPWVKKLAGRDFPCILEEKLDGSALSTARYWNGRTWVGPYEATLERKSFMPGNVGPSTGCSINAVCFYEDDEPLIARALNWNAYAASFLKHEAPPGLYDANVIVIDGEAFFLEWTPRFGWDSEGTSHLLFDDFSAWLWHLATGQGGADLEPARGDIALSIRLTVSPAPNEHVERDDKASCVGLPVNGEVGDLWSDGFVGYQLMHEDGELRVAAAEGLVGLSAAVGDSASDLAEEVIDFAKDELRVPGLMYWPLGVAEAINDDAEECEKQGFDDLPKGLMN